MVVAIDFTGSNGNPATPGTLHYLDPTGNVQNPYEATLTGLSSVLEQYGTYSTSDVRGRPVRLGVRLGVRVA